MITRVFSITLLLCWSAGGANLFAADEPEKPAADKKETAEAAPAKSAETAELKKIVPAKTKAAESDASKTVAKVAEPNADELAIRRNAEEYVIAYEAQDPEKLAGLWAPNAVWVNGKTGDRVAGRDAIHAHFAAMFEAADPIKLKVHIQDIHFTTPSVAVEDGTATIIRDGEEPTTTSYTAVHVLIDGKWLIDSVRETDLPPVATAADQLSQLDWLVGSWVDESDDATVVTTYHWTPNQNFLVQSFKVLIDGKLDMQGTQIIGWDASQGKIRGWLFDSDGGFSEGIWESEDDNRWVIRQSSTLPDGRHGSSINVLTKLDDDSFTWKSSGRQIEGELQPNIDEFTIVRQTTDAPDAESEEVTDAESETATESEPENDESLNTDQEESSDESQE